MNAFLGQVLWFDDPEVVEHLADVQHKAPAILPRPRDRKGPATLSGQGMGDPDRDEEPEVARRQKGLGVCGGVGCARPVHPQMACDRKV